MVQFSFTINEAQIRRRITENLQRESAVIRAAVLNEIVEATPVDTGEARRSWSIRVLDEERFLLENDEDYVKYLNAGSSAQAAAYFIERIVLKYGKPDGAIVHYN